MTDTTTATTENTNVGDAPTSEQVSTLVTEQQDPATEQVADPINKDAEVDTETKGAPEAYEFKAPEGQAFDDHVLAQFGDVAKELNLPQEAAQKILDKVAPAMLARQQEQIEALRNEWATSTKADKELGGANLNQNLASAKEALDKFGSPELVSLLNETGLGNHPAVIRAFLNIGKAIKEDTIVTGRQGDAPKSQADKLYGAPSK